jgi:glucans biosynthesis protein
VRGKKEEFPIFRAFWVIQPEPDAEALVVYALLDGPSITGAYRFDIRPGKETVISVRTSLFARKPVKSLGLAPLTSMYLYGQDRNSGPAERDHRPQVHDSDGLLIHTGAGEWLWRPLNNPPRNRSNSFGAGTSLGGFGLMQRDRQAEHYKDPRTRMEKRPSVWVEPVGPWPDGRVELLELSSVGEGMDNIVVQFVMDRAIEVGMKLQLQYRLGFYSHEKPLHTRAPAWFVHVSRRSPTAIKSLISTSQETSLLARSVRPLSNRGSQRPERMSLLWGCPERMRIVTVCAFASGQRAGQAR